MDPVAREMLRQYHYRHTVIPGLSFEAYLDEPVYTIEWMTRIHEAAEKARADNERGGSRDAGAPTPTIG